MSVYFWSVPVTAWKHKNTSSPPNTSLSLFLCQSVFLYHFVINIFKLIAGSHTHIQYILFSLLCTFVFLEAHPSTYFCQASIYSACLSGRNWTDCRHTCIRCTVSLIFIWLLKKVDLVCTAWTGTPANSGPPARNTETAHSGGRQTEPCSVNKHEEHCGKHTCTYTAASGAVSQRNGL